MNQLMSKFSLRVVFNFCSKSYESIYSNATRVLELQLSISWINKFFLLALRFIKNCIHVVITIHIVTEDTPYQISLIMLSVERGLMDNILIYMLFFKIMTCYIEHLHVHLNR